MSETQADTAQDQRTDAELRRIFLEAFALVTPFMRDDGNWLSEADEYLALTAMREHFPEITGMRLFALLGNIAGVRASGRTPIP
jgi:hypothetical protein